MLDAWKWPLTTFFTVLTFVSAQSYYVGRWKATVDQDINNLKSLISEAKLQREVLTERILKDHDVLIRLETNIDNITKLLEEMKRQNDQQTRQKNPIQ